MGIPFLSRGSDFRTGTHDGARINTELDQLYQDAANIQGQVDTTSGEVTDARTNTMGSYGNLKDSMQAIIDRINQALTGTSGTEVADGRTDAAGKVWSVIRDAINKGSKDLEGLTLQSLAKIVTSSASITSLCLCDTSRDSDGGSWLGRCQGFSWYSESSGATRGTKKSFPALAIAVGYNAGNGQPAIDIFDATDPALPLWMRLNCVGPYTWLCTSSGSPGVVISSLQYINGALYATNNGVNGTGLYKISFVTDEVIYWSNNSHLKTKTAIALRHSNGGNYGTMIDTAYLLNDIANMVDLYVYPDAPIDPSSGLPIPTIAVATGSANAQGAGSVIMPSGTIVDYNQAGTQGTGVQLLPNKRIAWTMSGLNPIHILALQNSDVATVNSVSLAFGISTVPATGGVAGKLIKRTGDAIAYPWAATNTSTANGLGLLWEEPSSLTAAKAMVSITRIDWLSGIMPGDIKFATLADCSSGTISAAEIVTNGTFDTDISGWADASDSGASISWSAGALSLNSTGTAASRARQTLYGVSGKLYRVKVMATGGQANVYIGGAPGGSEMLNTSINSGTLVTYFVPTAGAFYLSITRSPGTAITIDDVSIRLCVEDRSVKNKGFDIYGSITKTAVATGADLQWFSGYSAANYLEQPYNSDLDFGTGDFCILGWLKEAPNSATEMIFSRGAYAGAWSGSSIRLFVMADGTLRGEISDDALVSVDTVTSTAAIDNGTPHFFAFIRRGGVLELWLGAAKAANDTTITNAANSLSNANATTRLGLSTHGSNALTNGSIALIRVSATALTSEQIRTIYEAERPLFRENAKALLGGISNQVTCISSDPDTGLLNVGTTNGLSVFRGLQRVDYQSSATGMTGSSMKALSAARGAWLAANQYEAYFKLPQSNLRDPAQPKNLPAGIVRQAPTLTNSWANFGSGYQTAAYYKDALGFVHLEGHLKSGTIGQAMFTLPPGFRPAQNCAFPSYSNNGGVIVGSTIVYTDGTVVPTAGGNTAHSISGITFLAEA